MQAGKKVDYELTGGKMGSPHHIPSSRTPRNDVVGVYGRPTQKYPYMFVDPLLYECVPS